VIRLTEGHQAKIEEKPEVRKAGGVYYTPTYIVDYIVKNTVGKLLEGKTSKQATRLKILDPACGSGSFLLGAYRCMLDWHRDQYVQDGPEKHTKELFEGPGGLWRLTTSEKRRILINNIFGVDIDPQVGLCLDLQVATRAQSVLVIPKHQNVVPLHLVVDHFGSLCPPLFHWGQCVVDKNPLSVREKQRLQVKRAHDVEEKTGTLQHLLASDLDLVNCFAEKPIVLCGEEPPVKSQALDDLLHS
jgi:hypothetical protein